MVRPIQQWLLTFPRCNVAPSDLLTALGGLDTLLDYVIAGERHDDGRIHLHAYLKFKKGYRVRDALTTFDLIGCHGNYRPCRSPAAVIEYCTKGGDYVSSFDVMTYSRKKGKVTVALLASKTKATGGKYECNNHQVCPPFDLSAELPAKKSYILSLKEVVSDNEADCAMMKTRSLTLPQGNTNGYREEECFRQPHLTGTIVSDTTGPTLCSSKYGRTAVEQLTKNNFAPFEGKNFDARSCSTVTGRVFPIRVDDHEIISTLGTQCSSLTGSVSTSNWVPRKIFDDTVLQLDETVLQLQEERRLREEAEKRAERISQSASGGTKEVFCLEISSASRGDFNAQKHLVHTGGEAPIRLVALEDTTIVRFDSLDPPRVGARSSEPLATFHHEVRIAESVEGRGDSVGQEGVENQLLAPLDEEYYANILSSSRREHDDSKNLDDRIDTDLMMSLADLDCETSDSFSYGETVPYLSSVNEQSYHLNIHEAKDGDPSREEASETIVIESTAATAESPSYKNLIARIITDDTASTAEAKTIGAELNILPGDAVVPDVSTASKDEENEYPTTNHIRNSAVSDNKIKTENKNFEINLGDNQDALASCAPTLDADLENNLTRLRQTISKANPHLNSYECLPLVRTAMRTEKFATLGINTGSVETPKVLKKRGKVHKKHTPPRTRHQRKINPGFTLKPLSLEILVQLRKYDEQSYPQSTTTVQEKAILHDIYSSIRNDETFKTSSHGSTVSYAYAELTLSSADLLIDAYKSLGVNREDIFLDVGCGFGTFIAHAAHSIGCNCWGIEIDAMRVSHAARFFLKILTKNVDLRLCLFHGDVFDFDGFGPSTCVHLFDEAFEPWQVFHCILCALRSPSVRFVSSSKAGGPQKDTYTQFFELCGFTEVRRIIVRKAGCGSSNTFIIFEKTLNQENISCRSMFPVVMGKHNLSPVKFEEQHLNLGWNPSIEERGQYFHDIHQRTCDVVSCYSDTDIDRNLYGDRLNTNLSFFHARDHEACLILNTLLDPPFFIGKFGSLVSEDTLFIRPKSRHSCKSRYHRKAIQEVSFSDMMKDRRLPCGIRLSDTEVAAANDYLRTVTQIFDDSSNEYRSENLVCMKMERCGHRLKKVLTDNIIKLMHYAPSINPIIFNKR